jgi:hypothetical protein
MHVQFIDVLPLHSARIHDSPKPVCCTLFPGKPARRYDHAVRYIAIVDQHIAECCDLLFRDHDEMHRENRVAAAKSEDLFVLLHLINRDFTPDNLEKQPNMITHMHNP